MRIDKEKLSFYYLGVVMVVAVLVMFYMLGQAYLG